jgi:hypothetical protein
MPRKECMGGMGTRTRASGDVLDERCWDGIEDLVGMRLVGKDWQFLASSHVGGVDVSVLCCYSEGCSYCDGVGVGRDVDAIAHRQKGVEALDEVWIAGEETRNALNDARSVYSEWSSGLER